MSCVLSKLRLCRPFHIGHFLNPFANSSFPQSIHVKSFHIISQQQPCLFRIDISQNRRRYIPAIMPLTPPIILPFLKCISIVFWSIASLKLNRILTKLFAESIDKCSCHNSLARYCMQTEPFKFFCSTVSLWWRESFSHSHRLAFETSNLTFSVGNSLLENWAK